MLAELDLDGRLPPELQQTVGFTLEEDIESLDSISDCAMAQEIIANDILVSSPIFRAVTRDR